MKDDLISREEVKEILGTEWVKLFPMELDPYLSLAMEKIENIPSAQEWIPVTERLPEKEGLYLISHQNGKVFLDKWLGYDGWDSFISVTAWMPLPEPYEEADE